mmetsp:Transcript_52088/g.145236  ORF Transcript_52088/g.145236 Transcript_52088/m.145236 type:complete len:89 (+) Transcript_52088:3-269(+)
MGVHRDTLKDALAEQNAAQEAMYQDVMANMSEMLKQGMQGLSERLNTKINGLLEQNATLEAQNAQLKDGIESLSKSQHELNGTCVQRV